MKYQFRHLLGYLLYHTFEEPGYLRLPPHTSRVMQDVRGSGPKSDPSAKKRDEICSHICAGRETARHVDVPDPDAIHLNDQRNCSHSSCVASDCPSPPCSRRRGAQNGRQRPNVYVLSFIIQRLHGVLVRKQRELDTQKVEIIHAVAGLYSEMTSRPSWSRPRARPRPAIPRPRPRSKVT